MTETSQTSEPLRICLLASELAPFAKTGGLADVAAALGRYLHRAGHDVRIFLPLYRRVKGQIELRRHEALRSVQFSFGGRAWGCAGLVGKLPNSDCDVYFIEHHDLFDHDGIYLPGGRDDLRFTFFTRAVLECCQRLRFAPHVVHCNDWHTALMPLLLKHDYAWDQLFRGTKSLLSIHNIGYQGTTPAERVPVLGLEKARKLLHQGDLKKGRLNFLKTGILYASGLSTVSRTYAREIQTADFGVGLEGYLRARQHDLYGIVNGVDYGDWDPRHDAYLPARYGPDDLAGKRSCRDALLKNMGLQPVAGRVPVVGMVSRMTAQKGFRLLFDPLPRFLRQVDMRLCVLGSGEPSLEKDFRDLQRMFPGRVCYYEGYSNKLAHWIEAGADIFLMPSLYEPCGLNQMYSLRYGTVPVVRKTGGLADTVQQFDAATGEGTGFLFDHFTSAGFTWAFKRALLTFRSPELWHRLVQNGMAQDYSWDRQGPKYVQLYRHLAGV